MKKNRLFIYACLIGTALEWFDFSMFGMLSPVLAKVFFPEEEFSVSLFKILAVFSVGFVIRPIAAVFWGVIGDKINRQRVVVYTIGLMSLSSVLISLLPTYQAIGILAPTLLVLLRVMQGFSASGEHAGMLVYLYEVSGSAERLVWPSISMSGVFVGMAFASVIVFLSQKVMSHDSFLNWGWRLIFFISSAIGLLGCAYRSFIFGPTARKNNLHDKRDIKSYYNHLKETAKNTKMIIRGIGVFQLAVMVPYVVFVFAVTSAVHSGILDKGTVYLSTSINLFLTGIAVIYFAKLLDSLRKEYLVGFACIGITVSAVLFLPCLFKPDPFMYCIAQFVFGILSAMLVAPFCSDLARGFPEKIRYTGVSICLNFAASFFGGTAPLVMSYLYAKHNNMFYAKIYIVLSAIIALLSYKNILGNILKWKKPYLQETIYRKHSMALGTCMSCLL